MKKATDAKKCSGIISPYVHLFKPMFLIIDEYGRFAEYQDIQNKVMELVETAGFVNVHVIIATQRPDARTVLRPRIKQGLQARICFRVPDKNNSIVILDVEGAELLPTTKGRAILSDGDKKIIQVPYLTYPQCEELLQPFRSENMLTKVKRDQLILNYLTKFRVCSRNHLAKLIFMENSNPVNTTNKVMKRLVTDGLCLSIPRPKDKCYLYTANPSPIHHKSNKIDHYLKIVDFYIHSGLPENFVIEPILGSYEPDIFFRDKSNNHICVEVQITPISQNKMQDKINRFVSEYGKEHDSKVFVLSANHGYKNWICQKGLN
jgi:hypothetical protein